MFSTTLLAVCLAVGVASGVNVLSGRPTLCSEFTPVDFSDMRKLSGTWVTLESLMFYNGVPIHENHPDDDVQKCRDMCMRHSVQENISASSVKVLSEMKIASSYRNMTVSYVYVLESVAGQTGRWKIKTNETYYKDSEMLVLANKDTHLVLAVCKPDVYGSVRNNVPPNSMVLQNIGIIAHREERRGQNVYTLEEMQTRIDLMKLLGLSKVQWSIPFDSTC